MADTIQVGIVSAEKEIFSGQAAMVFAPASLGDVGIAPGHSPFITPMGPGEVRVRHDDGREQAFYISGGILDVQPGVVTLLSDTAVRDEDLDEAAVLKAREEAERLFHDHEATVDSAVAQAQLAETMAQLQAIQRLRRRAGRG